jgi:protein HOOK3
MQLEKDAIEKAHQTLIEDHRSLQSQLDDVLSERDDALARTRELLDQADTRRSDKADVSMKADMDRLRVDLYVVGLPLKIHFIIPPLIQTEERGESSGY